MDLIRPAGKVRRPTKEQLRAVGESLYIHLTDEELTDFLELGDEMLAQYDVVDELDEPQLPQEFPHRDGGHRPTREEDPYNIFIAKCMVKGADHGPLLGKRVGLKDNISLQGVPMTNGSRVCQGYIPNLDATVVTRLLRAGAVVVGKLNMDEFSFAGTSETSFYGAVRNPVNPEYSPGGSSSGAGAALANGDVDIAIAVDQGGSGRSPAARTGVTSIKPTHGLVPTFGLMLMDLTMDHVCPMTRTVSELAGALEVIAGSDPNDPQWTRGTIRTDQYTKHLRKDVSDIKIGVLKEAFEWPSSDKEINEATRNSLAGLAKLGATVEDVSIPMFKIGRAINTAIFITSFSAMFESNGDGFWHGGYYNTHWNQFFGSARKARSDEISPGVKRALVIGKYMRTEYYGVHHAKAMNLRRQFRGQISDALKKYNVLAFPTNPVKLSKLRTKIERTDMTKTTTSPANNNAAFNVTGHPAMTIPCGKIEGIPIGLQFVSNFYDEGTLFRVGHTFEQSFDWHNM